MGLLTRVGGETLRLFPEFGVQVDLGFAAARSALDGLVAPLRSSATLRRSYSSATPPVSQTADATVLPSIPLVRLVDGPPPPPVDRAPGERVGT